MKNDSAHERSPNSATKTGSAHDIRSNCATTNSARGTCPRYATRKAATNDSPRSSATKTGSATGNGARRS